MAIGRSFAEAIQKACQSLENEAVGLGYYGKSLMHAEEIIEYIKSSKVGQDFQHKRCVDDWSKCKDAFANQQA